MRMDFGELVRLYGPWAGLLAMVAWSLRAQIWQLIDRRARLGEADREQDLRFDEQARAKLLQNGDYNRELVSRFLSLYDAERADRKMMAERLVEQAASTEIMVRDALAIMQEFAAISRMQCDRLDTLAARLATALEKQTEILPPIWFVLAKYGLRPADVDHLISQMKENAGD